MVDTTGNDDTYVENDQPMSFKSRANNIRTPRAPEVSRREHNRQVQQEKALLKANSVEGSENKFSFAHPKTPSSFGLFKRATGMAPHSTPTNGFAFDKSTNTATNTTPLFNFVGPNTGKAGGQDTTQAPQQATPFEWQLNNTFAPNPAAPPAPAASPFQPPPHTTPFAYDPASSLFGRDPEVDGDEARRRSEAPLFNAQSSSDERPARDAFRGQRGRGQPQENRGNRGGRGGPGSGAKRG